MNPAIKTKWLDALRSGDYTQGYSKLRSKKNNSYCCLGVLCELAAEEGIVTISTDSRDDYTEYINPNDREDHSGTSLPLVVQEWSGLFRADVLDADLVTLNDSRMAPFTDIADVIEAKL